MNPSGSPEESAAPRNAGGAAGQAGEEPPPLTGRAAPWQPVPLPRVGLPTENRPDRTSAALCCPRGCGPCSGRWVSKAAGVRLRSPREGCRAGCPAHGALPSACSAVARVAGAHGDGGQRGPSNTLGGSTLGPHRPRGPISPPRQGPLLPQSVLRSWLRQACPRQPGWPSCTPSGQAGEGGVGRGTGPAWPQTCTVSDTTHCVLNPTSRPAGGFPAASTPSPFPRRVGLLSKVGRPWEVPRPPQGATPLGTGAHPRVPCVSKRCWGWYPEPPDSPAPLALQPQGGGWADGPNRVPQRFAGHRLPGAEAPQRDFVLPQRASVPLGEAWALPW